MNIRTEIKEAFVENKKIFTILLVIFILGFIVGVVIADDIAPVLMPALKELVKDANISSINAFSIMIHNETTAITVFLGSIIFGIYAIIGIFANGLVMGFMAGYTIKSTYALIIYIILIVPHGIIEIPAFFCSCTAGILLFLFVFRFIEDLIHKNTFKESYDNNKKTLKHAITLLSISLVLFAIAALIEGFITPELGNIINQQINGTRLF